jgi:mannitol/fructose-specific phosphotransferase system IIA component (Ntr-type)
MAITKIFPLFDEKRILFLDSSSKNTVIDEMIKVSKDCVTNLEGFKKSILNREAIVSTGIGHGFGIPHVKNKFVPEFFITLAIIKNGVDWDSLDNQPVYVAFMIGGPENSQNEYLSVLSKISLIIKNPLNKEKLLSASSFSDILDFFKKF